MRRINNKTKKSLSLDPFEKHPGKFLKRDTSGRIRQQGKQEIESYDPETVRTPPVKDRLEIRKRGGNCPICLSKLQRNNRGTRFSNSCGVCKARLRPEILCKNCNSNRVWGTEGDYRCKGCGKKVEAETQI